MFYNHLSAHSLLANCVDEDDDDDEVGLKEKPEDTRYIKIRPEAPGVRAKDLLNLIPIYCPHWDCGLGRGGGVQVRQA